MLASTGIDARLTSVDTLTVGTVKTGIFVHLAVIGCTANNRILSSNFICYVNESSYKRRVEWRQVESRSKPTGRYSVGTRKMAKCTPLLIFTLKLQKTCKFNHASFLVNSIVAKSFQTASFWIYWYLSLWDLVYMYLMVYVSTCSYLCFVWVHRFLCKSTYRYL